METFKLLLQIVNRHILEFDLLSTVDIGSVCYNTNGHAGAWNIREPMTK